MTYDVATRGAVKTDGNKVGEEFEGTFLETFFSKKSLCCNMLSNRANPNPSLFRKCSKSNPNFNPKF